MVNPPCTQGKAYQYYAGDTLWIVTYHQRAKHCSTGKGGVNRPNNSTSLVGVEEVQKVG